MRFWDASALVPLLIHEPTTPALRSLLESDQGMAVWWGTEVECASAIARTEREGNLEQSDVRAAFEHLDELRDAWHEIEPNESLRTTARRLLRTHPLRAADALQLSAALIASEGQPRSQEFVSLDDRLIDAARPEGLSVVDVGA